MVRPFSRPVYSAQGKGPRTSGLEVFFETPSLIRHQEAEANRPTSDPGQLRAAELTLHAAILGDNPDQQAIDAARTTINAAHAAELDHQIDMLAKVAQILTPDQRQQLIKLQSERPRGRGRGF